MKRTKLFAILLACLMVIAIVPVAVVPASAAEKVVYLAEDGEGDGSTPEKPLGDLLSAFAAIGDSDGTIVLVGELALFGEQRVEPHAGHITITGKYNGKDYEGALYAADTSTSGHWIMGGDVTLENMTVTLAGTWVIRANYHHLTFGEGFISKSDAHPNWPQLYVVGGENGADNATVDTTQDVHLTFKSGIFYEVIVGPRNGNSATTEYSGNCVVEVTNDVKIWKLFGMARGTANHNYATGLMVLDGGEIGCFAGAHDSKATGCLGDYTIVLTKNFDISKSFDAQGVRVDGASVYQGISGVSVFDGFESATTYANAKLLIDPSIKAAVDATDKINLDSFTSIEEYTYKGTIGSGTLEGGSAPVVTEPVVTEAPTTTVAPVVTEPATTTAAPVATEPVVTTAAPTQAEPTPSTGDGSVVLFAISAACLVAVAAMVFLKKRVAE